MEGVRDDAGEREYGDRRFEDDRADHRAPAAFREFVGESRLEEEGHRHEEAGRDPPGADRGERLLAFRIRRGRAEEVEGFGREITRIESERRGGQRSDRVRGEGGEDGARGQGEDDEGDHGASPVAGADEGARVVALRNEDEAEEGSDGRAAERSDALGAAAEGGEDDEGGEEVGEEAPPPEDSHPLRARGGQAGEPEERGDERGTCGVLVAPGRSRGDEDRVRGLDDEDAARGRRREGEEPAPRAHDRFEEGADDEEGEDEGEARVPGRRRPDAEDERPQASRVGGAGLDELLADPAGAGEDGDEEDGEREGDRGGSAAGPVECGASDSGDGRSDASQRGCGRERLHFLVGGSGAGGWTHRDLVRIEGPAGPGKRRH